MRELFDFNMDEESDVVERGIEYKAYSDGLDKNRNFRIDEPAARPVQIIEVEKAEPEKTVVAKRDVQSNAAYINTVQNSTVQNRYNSNTVQNNTANNKKSESDDSLFKALAAIMIIVILVKAFLL